MVSLQRFAALAVLILSGLALTACGLKPSHVDPPPTVEDDTYPNEYPDPATDPAPTK
jgi:hypothetical protein